MTLLRTTCNLLCGQRPVARYTPLLTLAQARLQPGPPGPELLACAALCPRCAATAVTQPRLGAWSRANR